MKTAFIIKAYSFVSSIINYWCIEAGIDLSLLKVIQVNAAVAMRTFGYDFFVEKAQGAIKIINENIRSGILHSHI